MTQPAPEATEIQAGWRPGSVGTQWFFFNDPIHDAMEEAIRRVPFGASRIPILSAEHLLVCKAAFDRPKDWLDIEQMILMTDRLDRGEVWKWMSRIEPAGESRSARLRDLLSDG